MILCCGEALIDMLPRRTDDGAETFQPCAGGAVFNTAIALGRLGAPASLFTGLSRDLFGQILSDALAAAGVDTRVAVHSDRPTTLAFVRLTDGQATYAFYDENTAVRMLTEADLPALPPEVSAVFFGGICLAVEPCAVAFEALMRREAGRRVTMIDPNVRPGLVGSNATYRDRIDRMIATADIVKVSDEDLRWLYGDRQLHDVAGAIVAAGARLVCVTAGAKGAWGVTADHSVFVEATQVTPVDTVGAGDTFNAGLLASLRAQGALTADGLAGLDEAALCDALSLATRAAAITVSRTGANPPTLAELS